MTENLLTPLKQKNDSQQETNAPEKLKVLIVDDDEVNMAILETALKKEFHVYTVYTGYDALQLLDLHLDMAAVITDIQMPGMDGKVLIQAIRSDDRFSDMVILANTLYRDFQQEERLLKIGADDFFYKPTTPAVVINRLKNVLAGHGLL